MRIRVGHLAVAIGISVLASVAIAAPASATDAPVWHWNIFGGCSTNGAGHSGNCGQPEPIQALHFQVATEPAPWFITLNEVCDLQVWELLSRLGPLGYSLHFDRTNGILNLPGPDPRYSQVFCGNPGSQGGIHGNIALSIGSPTASGSVDYSSQDPGDDYRSFGWMRVNTFFGAFRTAVSHLDYSSTNNGSNHSSTSTNGRQNTQMRGFFDLQALTGEKLVLGVDKNTTRHEPMGSYTEIDQASPKKRTYINHSLFWKYDWTYGGPGYSSRPGTDTYRPPYSPNPISDHAMLKGKFGF